MPAPHDAPMPDRADVVIIGGGIIGSADAWFLTDNPDFKGRIVVVERDPSYRFAATSHTNSCMRQQFTSRINIEMSRFGAQFVRNFQQYLGNDPRVPALAFDSFGYMTLAADQTPARALEASQRLQAACGAGTRTLSPGQIAREYPFYYLDDIIAANHNRVDEGYFDSGTMFDWWRRLARERGVVTLNQEVVSLTLNTAGTRIESVGLSSGHSIACGTVVNASGQYARQVAAMAGIELPVEPRKRFTYVFDAAEPLGRPLPLTVDPSGVHVRSDGRYYMAGCEPDLDTVVDHDDFDDRPALWEEKVWPAIAHRIPRFEAIKLINSWVGHYEYNTLDHNAVIGPHERVGNFYFANGFSGHGVQHAPATGRGLAELIIYGQYRSLDMSVLGYGRINRAEPVVEDAVI